MSQGVKGFKGNVSAEIRKCIKTGVQSPKEIAGIVSKKIGVTIRPSYASLIKCNMKRKKPVLAGSLASAGVLVLKSGGVETVIKKIKASSNLIVDFIVDCGGSEAAIQKVRELRTLISK